jgi:NTE family protein
VTQPRSEPVSRRRGLVLGGGGVLGAAWMTGALTAMSEALAWDPRTAEVIVGTSAGSVLTALLGSGLSIETLVNYQRGALAPDDRDLEVDPDTVSGGSTPPRPRLGIGSAALVGHSLRHPRQVPRLAALAALAPRGRGSLAAIGDLVRSANLDDAWPQQPATWVIAMDYGSGERVAFGQRGAPESRLSDAVRASCSIPGWYEPVVIGDRRYVDGGTLSPTSIDLLAGSGLDEVYVLAPTVSFDYDSPTSLAGRLERRFRRSMTRRALREAGAVRRTGTTVTIVGPGRDDLETIGVNLMDSTRRIAVLDTALSTTAALFGGAAPMPAVG